MYSPILESLNGIGLTGLVIALLALPFAAFRAHQRARNGLNKSLLVSSGLLAVSTLTFFTSLKLSHTDFFLTQDWAFAFGRWLDVVAVFSAAWTALTVVAYVLRSRQEA
jgi:hypothetical protein